MKKILLAGIAFLSFYTAGYAGNDKPVRPDQMPREAREFLNTFYKNTTVSFAKQETDWFEKNYKVILEDGTSVEFDRSGDWTEIKGKSTGVPVAILPAPVRAYLADKYEGVSVKQAERQDRQLEVELENGLEIRFNKKYEVVDIDL